MTQLIADRRDPETIRAALSREYWDAVFDVSGYIMATDAENFLALLDVLDGRAGRYVFVSSVMAYAPSGYFPWRETAPVTPDPPSTYGGFKAFAEQAILERFAASGFAATVARPAAIYGPENNIYDMETPMYLRLLQGRPILLPHGGLVAGSYGHVDDLCDVMVSMATETRAHGEVFNITADGLTSQRYVTTLAKIVGVEPDIVFVPDDVLPTLTTPVFSHLFGVRHHAIASIDKARSVVGFEPTYDFVGGHEVTYEWFQARGWGELREPLVDPMWGASWDFDAEATLAARLR